MDFELVVVDNDSGAEYLDRLRRRLTVPLVANKRNKGFGSGHNIGFHQSCSEADYHLVLNPDVIIHEGCLEKLITHMDAHPEIGLIAPKIFSPDGSIQHLNKRAPTVLDLFIRRFVPEVLADRGLFGRRRGYFTMMDVGYDSPCDVPFMSGCFMLFRREMFERVGGFDEGIFMYLEDADITRRIGEVSRTVFLPDASITHNWSRGSHRSWFLTWVTVRSSIYFFQKWGWRWT